MRWSTRRTVRCSCPCCSEARTARRRTRPITVHYTTIDGTASAGVDYGRVSGTLSFAPGQTVKNIVVPILDAGPRSASNFEVSLDSVSNAGIADGTGIVTITASAGAAVALPALSAPPDVTVGEGDGYVDLAGDARERRASTR